MKILGFLLAVLFTFGVGMTSAHGYPVNGLSSSAYRGLDKDIIVLAQAKATPPEGEIAKFEKKAKETINEYKGKLKELEAKAKNQSEKAKAEAKEGMDELRKKVDVAQQKIKAIRAASGDAWEKLKAEVDSSLESVKETYKRIAARFE